MNGTPSSSPVKNRQILFPFQFVQRLRVWCGKACSRVSACCNGTMRSDRPPVADEDGDVSHCNNVNPINIEDNLSLSASHRP